MRELEFLPDWYVKNQRRSQIVVLQAVVLALLVIGSGVWLFQSRRNIAAANAALDSINVQIVQSETELDQLQDQLKLKEQLERRREVTEALGVNVDTTRLLTTLAEAMPRTMSLLECDVTTEEKTLAAGTPANGVAKPKPVVERWLKARVVGVAPSDVEVARFIATLTQYPFIMVDLKRSEGHRLDSHEMRRFEVALTMNLSGGVAE